MCEVSKEEASILTRTYIEQVTFFFRVYHVGKESYLPGLLSGTIKSRHVVDPSRTLSIGRENPFPRLDQSLRLVNLFGGNLVLVAQISVWLLAN